MLTLLLVDAHPLVRELLSTALRPHDMRCLAASDEDEARAMLSFHAPDAIVIDPFGHSRQESRFLSWLREQPNGATMPVVVLTDIATRETVKIAVEHRVAGYLIKRQFSLSRFVQTVRRAVNARVASDPALLGNANAPATEQDGERPPIRIEQVQAGMQSGASTGGAGVVGASVEKPKPAPDPAEALRTLMPVVKRSELQERMDEAQELRALSPTVGRLMTLADNPNSSIDDIVKAVKLDQAIALKLLRLSNSTVYNRGEQCDSIKKAVLRIGGSQIKQAVMNLSVIDQFSCSDAMGGLDTKHFWEHAIACGLIAGRLAKPRGDEFADSAMTMGLLHDIGRMILAHAAPDEYRQVLETANSMELPLEQVEKRMLMVDHAEVMDRILRTWQFPKALFNPIVFHHLSAGNIRRAVPQESQEAATLALANCLAHAMLLGSSGNETIYPIEDLCDMLRLDPKQIMTIEREVPDETSDLKFSMLSRSDLGSWTERSAEWADAFGCEFRPLVVSLKPEFDSIRILCERLKDPMQSGKPNIALVRIRNPRERVPIGQALVEAERAAGVENLPVIAMSAGGELALEHGLASRRINRNMRIPFAMNRFVRTVRELLDEQGRALSEAA